MHRVIPRRIPRVKRTPSGRGSKSGIHSYCSDNLSVGRSSSRNAGVFISIPFPKHEKTWQLHCKSESATDKFELMLPRSPWVPCPSLCQPFDTSGCSRAGAESWCTPGTLSVWQRSKLVFSRAITSSVLSPISPRSVPKATRLVRGNAFPWGVATETENESWDVVRPGTEGTRWAVAPCGRRGPGVEKKAGGGETENDQ